MLENGGCLRQEAGASEMIFAAINKSQGQGKGRYHCHGVPTILPAAFGVPEALAQVNAQVCHDCNHVLMANISEPHFI